MDKYSTIIVHALELFIGTFGIPETIHTDRSFQFCSLFLNDMYTEFGICHIITSPYHPKANGALERMYQEVKKYFKR